MKTWKEYYNDCKSIYSPDNESSIYDLTIEVLNQSNNKMGFDENYYNQIQAIKHKLDEHTSNPSKYSRQNIAMGINNIFEYEEELSDLIENYYKPYLEENIFGCHVQCDNIKMYKTPTVNQSESSSWMWHIDNSPIEQIKIMVYFNDVNKKTGAFKYLGYEDGGVKVKPTRIDCNSWYDGGNEPLEALGVKWKGTRVSPNVINELSSWPHNCTPVDVESEAGTAIIFDNNIIHKGTHPTEGFRYAATLQFKPIYEKIVNAFSKEVTGNGWQHATFHKDPSITHPVKR